ncbi:SpoIIE family protein phosphatase [Psychrobacillus antarcticus]|uniref:SpoIIE family protein phosphatase n=1 Tax=Psychrobacillus antarcticus TaxID=2879115 RepID=UPI002407BA7B|nr:SpoIIE family protein phosphatase [Psychrobacillus antarcticus]
MKTIYEQEQKRSLSLRKITEGLKARRITLFFSFIFLLLSFFLAQVVLFEASVPFFLPLWALVNLRFQRYVPWTIVGAILGSFTLGFGQVIIHALQALLFPFYQNRFINKIPLPIFVLIDVVFIQIVWQFVSYGGEIPLTIWLAVGYEGVLSLFMTIFLFQLFLPFPDLLHKRWTGERMGAALLIGALVLTGMSSYIFGYVSIPLMAAHLVIAVSAAIGGVQLATVVAVLSGTILSISKLSFSGMIAVYAVTGFLAGLHKPFGRLWQAFSMLGATFFFILYDRSLPLDSVYIGSLVVASLLFFMVPSAWIKQLKDQLYPDTTSVLLRRQKWMTEKVNHQLQEFQHFVDFITRFISERFDSKALRKDEKTEPLPICRSCFQYEKCWGEKSNGMPVLIKEWEEQPRKSRMQTENRIQYKCVKPVQVMHELKGKEAKQQLTYELQHGKKMFALKLKDMGNHMSGLMSNLENNITMYSSHEEVIRQKFQQANIPFFQIDVLNIEIGQMEIVCCLPIEARAKMVGERLIVPLMYELWNEPFEISVMKEIDHPYEHIQLTFKSSVRFHIKHDVYTSSSRNTIYSGDAHAVFPLHPGLMAVILSDGMGNDVEAHRESRRVMQFMRECLNKKMDPETTMHTLHYMMSLQNDNDSYATVDLALIDLQKGELWSWKAGSMSTYLIRGNEMRKIESKHVPFGFLPTFSIEARKMDLKDGDVLVMLSDGVFSSNTTVEKQEQYYQKILQDPTMNAERFVKKLEETYSLPGDDRTVIFMQIEHVVPEWSLFTPRQTAKHQEKMVH